MARRTRFLVSSRSRQPLQVRDWLANIRLSGFAAIMLGLVVLGALVLLPSIGTLIEQRQQVAALEQAVAVGEDEIERLQAQRERWDDPAYIAAQARERLYYVHPGEVVYLIDNDLPDERQPQRQRPVSEQIVRTQTDWMGQLVRSVTEAGLAEVVIAPAIGVPDPTPAPTETQP